MAASEHTPHYSLSQFGPDNRPSWIDDYNADMRIIDTAIHDESQTVADMTDEITDIKNRLDTSNAVFNYFRWSGRGEVALSAWATFGDMVTIADPSQGGIGDNEIISLLTLNGFPSGKIIQINQEGTYVIWSTINIGLFSPARQNRSAALSLQYSNDGIESETMNVINGSFVTPLVANGVEIAKITQSLSLPPTVVSLHAGAVMSIVVNASANDETNVEPIKAPHMESSTGIVKIR